MTRAGAWWLRHPRPKTGGQRAYQILTLAGIVPEPPGIEEATMGCSPLLCWNWGIPTPLLPTSVGHENMLQTLYFNSPLPRVCGHEGYYRDRGHALGERRITHLDPRGEADVRPQRPDIEAEVGEFDEALYVRS
jgi:hypothetical protein